MMITMWVDGRDHDVPADQVIPWVCGIHGVLDTIDLGFHRPITVDVDPSASDRPGTVYIIEIDGVRHNLAESWVLPWMRGLAIRHGITDRAICDPSAAERAQRVQALMAGHQLGLFTYAGFTTHKKDATT
jgi:hypothetical protein